MSDKIITPKQEAKDSVREMRIAEFHKNVDAYQKELVALNKKYNMILVPKLEIALAPEKPEDK